jgi:hypothetical protein
MITHANNCDGWASDDIECDGFGGEFTSPVCTIRRGDTIRGPNCISRQTVTGIVLNDWDRKYYSIRNDLGVFAIIRQKAKKVLDTAPET